MGFKEEKYEKFFYAGASFSNNRVRRINLFETQFRKNVSKELAESIISELLLAINSPPDIRAEWGETLSIFLESRFNEKTVKAIRQGCYCNENGRLEDMANSLKQLYLSLNKSLCRLVNALNESGAGWFIKNN